MASAKYFEDFGEPLCSEFLELWKEFETAKTRLFLLVQWIRIMPFIINVHTSGKSWTEAQISQQREMCEEAVKKVLPNWEAFEILLKRLWRKENYASSSW